MKFLEKFRREKGLTQAELAEKVNVGINSIARYERGEVTPSITIAHAIAVALQVTEAELLNGPKEGKIEINLIFGEMSEKGEIDMSESGNKFDLFMDKNGTLGIRGGAKFTSLEDIAQFVADIGEELKKGFEFQQSRGAISGAD